MEIVTQVFSKGTGFLVTPLAGSVPLVVANHPAAQPDPKSPPPSEGSAWGLALTRAHSPGHVRQWPYDRFQLDV